MTINIGINLGDYVLLAADTRSVRSLRDTIISHSDRHEKVQKSEMGLIAGAGYADLLDDVKKQIAQENIRHTDQIIHIIKKCRENLSIKSTSSPIMVSNWIKITSWLLTYTTSVHRSPVLRLALIQSDDEISCYPKNKSCVIMPSDSTHEEVERITSLVDDNIKRLHGLARRDENISYHVTLIREVIKGVSQSHESVSQSFQIGIHTIDGRTGISGISENGSFSLSWS